MKPSDDDDYEALWMGVGVRIWALIGALVFATSLAITVLARPQRDFQTRAQRREIGYISAHQASLRMLYSQYVVPTATIEQRRAIFQQMRFEADLIPSDVPPDIRAVLAQGAP